MEFKSILPIILAYIVIAPHLSMASADTFYGKFSISPTQQIHFAPGNLQYQSTTKTWRFAEHQWDYIGDANKNTSSTYEGWIDLFGWGTGSNPTNVFMDEDAYTTFSDWGNNTISNADGLQWRTLTNDEWGYVFNERKTVSGIRFAKATVNGTDANHAGFYGYYWSSTVYSNLDSCGVFFDNRSLFPQSVLLKEYGFSVRLVCPAE